MKMPNFTIMEDINKRQQNFLSFSEKEFAKIWQSELGLPRRRLREREFNSKATFLPLLLLSDHTPAFHDYWQAILWVGTFSDVGQSCYLRHEAGISSGCGHLGSGSGTWGWTSSLHRNPVHMHSLGCYGTLQTGTQRGWWSQLLWVRELKKRCPSRPFHWGERAWPDKEKMKPQYYSCVMSQLVDFIRWKLSS